MTRQVRPRAPSAQRGAMRAAQGLVVVVTGLGRHRQLELVGNLEDLLLDQVDVGGDAVNGVRPRQVVLLGLDEREHAHHPPTVVFSHPEHARGDRAGPDLTHVIQAPSGHGRAPPRVRPDDLVHPCEVALKDWHLAVGTRVQLARADHLLVRQRHHRVGRFAGVQVDQERAQPAIRGRAGQHFVLGRLLKTVVGEPGRFGHQPGRRHDVPSRQVLGAAAGSSGCARFELAERELDISSVRTAVSVMADLPGI